MQTSKFNLSAIDSLCERTLKAPLPKRPTYAFRGQDVKIPSLKTADPFVGTSKTNVYTGTAMLGVATMHKSNAVPVFSEQNAQDISKMRR